MKSEIKNGIIVLLVVLGILSIVYFATAYRTGQISHKKYDNNSEITNKDPSYSNMIIYSKVFSQKEEKYMVLFFDNTKIKDSLSTTIDLYDKNEENIESEGEAASSSDSDVSTDIKSCVNINGYNYIGIIYIPSLNNPQQNKA